MQTWRLRANLAEARGWRKPARNLPKPGEAGRNPAEPGGTRRNPAEPGGTWRNPGLYSQPPPPSTYFFSARFPPGSAGFRRVPPGFRQVSARFRRVPPGSAGFRRVPPGSAGFRRVPPGFAGFRRVPLGSAAPLGSARFRWVPGFRQVSSAGLCRVLPFPPTRFLLPTPPSILQFIARIVPGSCQASVKVAAIKEAFFASARTLSKSAYGKNHQ